MTQDLSAQLASPLGFSASDSTVEGEKLWLKAGGYEEKACISEISIVQAVSPALPTRGDGLGRAVSTAYCSAFYVLSLRKPIPWLLPLQGTPSTSLLLPCLYLSWETNLTALPPVTKVLSNIYPRPIIFITSPGLLKCHSYKIVPTFPLFNSRVQFLLSPCLCFAIWCRLERDSWTKVLKRCLSSEKRVTTTSGSSLEAGESLLAEICARQQIHLLPNAAEEQRDGWAMKGRKLGDAFSFI